MPKYVAKRKDVCAGLLTKPEDAALAVEIYDNFDRKISEDDLEKMGIFNFSCYAALVCRGMLFSVNENGLSNDLIYTTPTNYPIKGIEPKIDVASQFVIDEYVELEELLKYLNYGVDLTQGDLNQIYRKFITRNWWLNHHKELFGYKSLGTGEYISGGTQTIPINIYNSLSSIGCNKMGRPNIEEPEYSRIRRRK